MVERGSPFNIEQRLSEIGVTQREISTIRGITAAHRAHTSAGRALGESPDFLRTSGLFSGDYQKKVVDALKTINTRNYFPLCIENVTQTPTRQRLPRRFQGTERNREVKEVLPVEDVAGEIAKYARGLLEKGESPVTLVDLGAGAIKTTARVARLLQDEVREGKVRIYATNIDTSPTLQDIAAIGRTLDPFHAEDLIRAIHRESIKFETADVLELYQKLQGDPVHLLLMMDVFPSMDNYTGAALKITNDMLHPRYGTSVYCLTKTGEAGEDLRLPIIREGLNDLIGQRGFQKRYPLQAEPGVLGIPPQPLPSEPAKPRLLKFELGELQRFEGREDFPLEVYQGPEAPQLPLYKVGPVRNSF